jgi:peptidoglycan lytic transglycosylase
MRRRIIATGALVMILLFGAVAGAHHRSYWGRATYYASRYVGQTMACGGTYRHHKMVAAADKKLNLPCGKRVRVKNRGNGKTVIVKIKDRCSCDGRVIIDVSRRAARKLGFVRAGVAKVKVTRLHDG